MDTFVCRMNLSRECVSAQNLETVKQT